MSGRRTKLEVFVEARLAGHGPRKAARIADYSRGVPPSSAVEVAEKALQIQSMPEAEQWARARVQGHREKEADIRQTERALQVLEQLGQCAEV